MKKFSVLFVALIIAMGFVACKEDDKEAKDETKPVIVISSPEADASFKDGAEFQLKVNITDDKELAWWDYSITITDEQPAKKNTQEWVVKFEDTKEDLSGLTAEKTPTVKVKDQARVGTYLITVRAEDKSKNQSQETVKIKVIPAE